MLTTAATPPLQLVSLQTAAIDLAEAQWVYDPAAGGVCVFVGTTRAQTRDDGSALVALDYDAYPEMAQRQLTELAAAAGARWPVVRLVLLHRVGRVAVGEPSVLIAVATPHRPDAFEACRWLIDALKADVAIWKQDVWPDGTGDWKHP